MRISNVLAWNLFEAHAEEGYNGNHFQSLVSQLNASQTYTYTLLLKVTNKHSLHDLRPNHAKHGTGVCVCEINSIINDSSFHIIQLTAGTSYNPTYLALIRPPSPSNTQHQRENETQLGDDIKQSQQGGPTRRLRKHAEGHCLR